MTEQAPKVPPGWPEAVLFDLDGTLADSFAAIAEALDRVLVGNGFSARGTAWARRHVGRGATALVCDALEAEAGSAMVRVVEGQFFERYREMFVAATPPMAGALATVQWAHRLTGGRVGIVSNKAAALSRMWIDHHGFAAWVAALAGPDSSGFRKPDPRAVEPVLQELGAPAANSLLVGDMTVDVAVGAAVGMPVVTVHGQTSTRDELMSAGAAAVLDDLRDLQGWVEREISRRGLPGHSAGGNS